MRRPLFLTTVAVAAFALTAFGLGRIAPYPEMGDLDDKLRFYEEHRDGYDTLFFGSSRVLRGVVPEVFDAEAARLGEPARSFNFGIDGMEGHETAALVRRVLAMAPGGLRRVVVELPAAGAFGAEIHPENRFKARMVFWHDPEETRAAAGSALASGAGGWRAAKDHLLHGLAEATAAGRGRALLREARERFGPVPGGHRTSLEPTELARSAGFEPFSEAAYGTPTTHPYRRRFLRGIPEYRRVVAALATADRFAPAASDPGAPAGTVHEAALADLVARLDGAIRRAGAEPVFLVTPTVRPAPELHRLAAAGRVPGFVAFDDPAAYPHLFAVENRFDADHLTTGGARRFSRLLAERLTGRPDPAESPDPRLVAERR